MPANLLCVKLFAHSAAACTSTDCMVLVRSHVHVPRFNSVSKLSYLSVFLLLTKPGALQSAPAREHLLDLSSHPGVARKRYLLTPGAE